MQKYWWLILIAIIVACAVGLWFMEGKGFEALTDLGESNTRVEQLKDLYGQAEFMENQIRTMQLNNEDYTTEQKALEEIHNSIENLRSELENESKNTGLSTETDKGSTAVLKDFKCSIQY